MKQSKRQFNFCLLSLTVFVSSANAQQMMAGGGYQMPQGSLQAVNPGAAQYMPSMGAGEQPAYYQGSGGVNCVPRGYSSPIEGPIANGAPMMIGNGSTHGQ